MMPVDAAARGRPAYAQEGTLSHLQERCSSAWRTAKSTMTDTMNMIGFFAFRVLQMISPSLGPTIEVVYLRICNVWTAIKAAWREEEIAKRLQQLEAENARLKGEIADLRDCRTAVRDGAAAILAERASGQ